MADGAEELDSLWERLVAAGNGDVAIERDELYELFAALAPGGRAEEMEIAFFARIAGEQPVDAFGLRLGRWRIDVRARLAQSAVAGSVLAGMMAVSGTSSPSVAVLALVLPWLVDIERVEIRTRDRIIAAHLLDAGALEDPERAYAALPDDLRSQLTLLEFADVLDRLRAAEALPGRVELPPDRRVGPGATWDDQPSS